MLRRIQRAFKELYPYRQFNKGIEYRIAGLNTKLANVLLANKQEPFVLSFLLKGNYLHFYSTTIYIYI